MASTSDAPTTTTTTSTTYHLQGLKVAKAYQIPEGGEPTKAHDPVESRFCLLWSNGVKSACFFYEHRLKHPTKVSLNLPLYHKSLWYFTRLMMVFMTPVLVGHEFKMPEGKTLVSLAQKPRKGTKEDWFEREWGLLVLKACSKPLHGKAMETKCVKARRNVVTQEGNGLSQARPQVNKKRVASYVHISMGKPRVDCKYHWQKNLDAHQFMCWLAWGPPPSPEERQVLHLCSDKCCLNPWHLMWGTPCDNLQHRLARTSRGR
jgi:hypothetical protein